MEIIKRKYKYYFFIPQMFDNEKVFSGTRKAICLGQKNIKKIKKWYNTNKFYNNVSYMVNNEHHNFLNKNYNYLVVEYPINFNESMRTLVDIDNDGNYLLDNYFISNVQNK
jgi:hypothetical protein